MLAFTIGDDWLMDRRLVEVDVAGSLAHVDGLLTAELVSAEDHGAIRAGLEQLLAGWRAGEWDVEPGDEDVHSAIERRLTELVGEPGNRLHTGRSRIDQVALDLRLWLHEAAFGVRARLDALIEACSELAYVTALESVALDLGKLAFDLWLFSSSEFSFVKLPVAFTTGASLMPHKRNPDLIELLRANARQVVAERAALPITTRLLAELEFDAEALERAASDPALQNTARALERAQRGEAFRDAYRDESRGGGA